MAKGSSSMLRKPRPWSLSPCVTWDRSLSLPVSVSPIRNDGVGSWIRASLFYIARSGGVLFRDSLRTDGVTLVVGRHVEKQRSHALQVALRVNWCNSVEDFWGL